MRERPNSPSLCDGIKDQQDPGIVHGLEASAKPESNDDIPINLAPHIEDSHHHLVHEGGQANEERSYNIAQPAEQQHEEVVRRAPAEMH